MSDPKRYLATIHVYIVADSQGEACDVVSESLSPLAADDGPRIIDWGYLKLGEQRLYPHEFMGRTPEEEYQRNRTED